LWSSNVTAERELVARMRAGDQRAFDAFFNAYATRLAGFAARRCALDAAGLEDVVQQTMINAVKNLGTFGDMLCISSNRLSSLGKNEI
jgi:DNA-directed RNA polymerase specialized sigma24 family protein